MTVGERIRAARKAKGLTQKALGEACGIAEPTIRRYELGKLNPKYKTLEKIATALNTSAAELMGIGIAPLDHWLERYQGLYQLVEEPFEIPKTFQEFAKSNPRYEDQELFDDVQSLTVIHTCLRQLGFRVEKVQADETLIIYNRRTGLVYVISKEAYFQAEEKILDFIKKNISSVLNGAIETMTLQESANRELLGDIDFHFLEPCVFDENGKPITFGSLHHSSVPKENKNKSTPEDGESRPEAPTEPKNAPKQGGE